MAVFRVKSVVCCVLLFVVTAQCLAISQSLKLWKEHQNRTANFKCREPRLMSFKASELFSDLPENIDPIETVLYRCAATTGCCESKHDVCAVVSEEDVTLVFFQLSTGLFFERQEKNHTECGCQQKTSIK